MNTQIGRRATGREIQTTLAAATLCNIKVKPIKPTGGQPLLLVAMVLGRWKKSVVAIAVRQALAVHQVPAVLQALQALLVLVSILALARVSMATLIGLKPAGTASLATRLAAM